MRVMQTGFSDTSTTKKMPNADPTPTDLKKVHTLLCSAEDNIRAIFKVSHVYVYISSQHWLGDQTLLFKLTNTLTDELFKFNITLEG